MSGRAYPAVMTSHLRVFVPVLLSLSLGAIACSGESDDVSSPAASAGTSGAGGAAGQGGGAGNAGAGLGGSAGSPAGNDPCVAACTHVIAAGCPGTASLEDCIANCPDAAKAHPSCQDKANDVRACQSTAPVACNAGGGVTFGAACDAQTKSLLSCAVCDPSPKDTLCTACLKDTCCSDVKEAASAPGTIEFVNCLKPCKGAASCEHACEASYPAAAAAAGKVKWCADTVCPAACKTGGTADDMVSVYCKMELESGCSTHATVEACEQDVHAAAVALGCGGAFFSAFKCSLNTGVTCVGGKPAFDPSCQAIIKAGCGP